MGSYDTGEYSYTPRRSISEGRSSSSSSSSSSGSSSSDSGTSRRQTRQQEGRTDAPAYNKPAPQSQYDASLPTIAALGGGLTPARIVKELPAEMKEKPLNDIIDYLMSAEVVSTKEETSIVEAIKSRQRGNDYRAVVNNFYNLHNSKLAQETATGHYQKKERRTAEGTKSINFLDLAIVSHDEGGVAHKYSLEERF